MSRITSAGFDKADDGPEERTKFPNILILKKDGASGGVDRILSVVIDDMPIRFVKSITTKHDLYTPATVTLELIANVTYMDAEDFDLVSDPHDPRRYVNTDADDKDSPETYEHEVTAAPGF